MVSAAIAVYPHKNVLRSSGTGNIVNTHFKKGILLTLASVIRCDSVLFVQCFHQGPKYSS